MVRPIRNFSPLALVLLTSVLSVFGQTPDEVSLGFTLREKILSAHPESEDAYSRSLATRAFDLLLASPTRAAGPNLKYRVTVIQDDSVNAFTTPGGEIYVHSGLTPVLGDDVGMWAAVLGHELAHSTAEHYYKAYLRAMAKNEFKQGLFQILAPKVSYDTLNGLGTLSDAGFGLINKKLSRDDESEADRLGLMMMAEAGIHPDFALTLQRRMKRRLGEQSSLTTFFFSDHPRWSTREQRTLKAYREALTVFQEKWPDASKSPAGDPPIVATFGKLSTAFDDQNKSATIKVPLVLRNAQQKDVAVVVRFTRQNKPVQTSSDQHRLQDDSLGVRQPLIIDSTSYSSVMSFTFPTSALKNPKNRSMTAVVSIFSGDELVETSQSIPVIFPKN